MSNYLGTSKLGSFSKFIDQNGVDKSSSRHGNGYEKSENWRERKHNQITYTGLRGKRPLPGPNDNFEIRYRENIKTKKDFGDRLAHSVYFQVKKYSDHLNTEHLNTIFFSVRYSNG